MNELNSILQKFEFVTLADIEEVKLMNRIDRKYWFQISKLNELLEKVLTDYDILEVNGQRLMEYRSIYFDTLDNAMYLKHHNRKLNRYKIRQRKYTATDEAFFEIKFKTNKKRTIKQRISTTIVGNGLLDAENDFVQEKSPIDSKNLVKSLNNRFSRITLIHKSKKERCTIDLHPEFWNENGTVGFNKLVILELKRGQGLKSSPMLSTLRKLQIRQRGLSKYCTGRAVLDSKLKQNAFKARLRFLYRKLN